LHLPITPQLDEQRLPLLRTFVSRRAKLSVALCNLMTGDEAVGGITAPV